MANARSRYDTIAGYVQRIHDAHAGLLYGKPCLLLEGRAFAAYQPDAMAFRLHGRALTQALALPGTKGWDPMHADRTAPGWVLVPGTQVMRWDRLALDAVRCARESFERRVTYTPPQPVVVPPAPPPSTPASLTQRFTAAVSAGFRSLTLSKID